MAIITKVWGVGASILLTMVYLSCESDKVDNPLLPSTGGGDFSPTAQALGCTDPNAANYASEANVDDGSCTYHDFTKLTRAVLLEGATQNFLAEDMTGNWCGWCPGATKAIERLDEDISNAFSAKVIKIEVHYSPPPEQAATPSSLDRWRNEYGAPGAPHIVINFTTRIPSISKGLQSIRDFTANLLNDGFDAQQAAVYINLQLVPVMVGEEEMKVLFSFAVDEVDAAKAAHEFYYAILLLVDLPKFAEQVNFYSGLNGNEDDFSSLYAAGNPIKEWDNLNVFVDYVVKEGRIMLSSRSSSQAVFTRAHTYRFVSFGAIGDVLLRTPSLVGVVYRKEGDEKIFLNVEELLFN